MPPKRKSGFFAYTEQPADEAARQREVEALLTVRRIFPQDIAIERIQPNPFQARRNFTDLDELAEAIRQQGFTSRLRVRPDQARNGFFQLVYGERRLRAAVRAGLTEIPCDVAEHTDDDLIEIGLAENIQRHDLEPLEEAHAFQTFIEGRGYSIRRLAERIGKNKSYVEDRLALLRIPEDVQQMIEQRPDALRAAREIAKLPNAAERAEVIAGVVEGRLSTQGVRHRVREVANAAAQTTASSPHSTTTQRAIERDAAIIQEIFGRWRQLAAQDAATHIMLSEHTGQLLLAFQELIQSFET